MNSCRIKEVLPWGGAPCHPPQALFLVSPNLDQGLIKKSLSNLSLFLCLHCNQLVCFYYFTAGFHSITA